MPSAVLSAIEQWAWQAARARDLTLARELVRRHGIVHTPPELARAVVRESDRLLREHLALAGGVCDPRLLVIDPACGPGAFLAAALAVAEERGPPAAVSGIGFDLDAAALTIAGALCAHPAGGRLSFERADLLDGGRLLARAAEHDGPLLVIANPPWTNASAQPTAASQRLLEDFRLDGEGVRLPERKLGVLSDAYVRCFRACVEVARRSSAGAVVALVSNASYLDGPVHRGMRAALLRWFDALQVLDLGGSALLARSREQQDENVFGVRPSVAVTWLCRWPAAAHGGGPTTRRVHYARWTGSKRDKLRRLAEIGAGELEVASFQPEPPLLRFVPTARCDAAYAEFRSLAEWLPFHREGVQSNRDAVVIDDQPERLLARLHAFARGRALPELAKANSALAHYDPERARRNVAERLERDPDGSRGETMQHIAYRPYDERFFCPVAPLCHRPRAELSRALAQSHSALVSVRKDRGELPWTHAAWVFSTVDNCFLSVRSSCRARAFPLCDPSGVDNLSSELRESLAARSGEAVTALGFQHYALCVLSAASYRARWDAELRRDYPRIPLPHTPQGFRTLSELGERLAALYRTPHETTLRVPEPPAHARHRDLRIIAADGSIRLADVTLLQLEPAALELSLGHHRPLAAYVGARADRPLDRAALGAVFARAERLAKLQTQLQQLDRSVAREFGWETA